MSNPGRLTICLLVVPAILASGCGSSKTASTDTTASVNATGTSAPANASTQTASQSTGSKGSQQTSTAPARKATKATPKTQAPPSHTSTQAPKPRTKATPKPRTKATKPQAPPRSGYQFPPEFKSNFLAAWTAANGSKSSGECVIAKYEARHVVLGLALAELVGFQTALNNHLKLNRRSRQYVKECHSAIK